MQALRQATPSAPSDQRSSAGDPFGAIGRLARDQPSPSEFARRALETVARYFAAPAGVITRRLTGGDIRHTWGPEQEALELWGGVLERLTLVSQGEGKAIARVYGDGSAQPRAAALSCPITNSAGEGVGALAVVTECASRVEAEAALSELRALAAFIGLEFPSPTRAGSPVEALPGLSASLARASTYRTLHEFAFAITNNLRNRAGCEQVSLSLARGARLRLLSISGLDDLKPRSPGTLHIRQAMEECLDRREAIVCQCTRAWESDAQGTGHRLHRQWHEEAGRASVLSLPLLDEETVIAVLSFRRDAGHPYSDEDIDRIREMIRPLGPALRLVARASRPLAGHTLDAIGQGLRWLARPVGLGRKLALGAGIGLACWFCFGQARYQVAATGVIAPSQIRSIAAPYEASIAEVFVEVGDRVRAGDPLVRLETADLDLQKRELEAEHGAASSDIERAIAGGDVGEAGLASARRRIVEARLSLVQARIDRATIVAPEDGIILAGDLVERVGETVPLGEPLMRFAPTDSLKVEIEIPEALADDVRAGFPVRFASDARPEAPDAGVVERIRPAAEVRRGRTVFVADVRLTGGDDSGWMRAGMEGVAKIDCGLRPAWWVSLHKPLDYLHLRVLP